MIIDELWRIAIGDTLACCKQGWESQGFDVNHFEAITPTTMSDYLRFTHKDRNNPENDLVDFTPTEKAIWYSHVSLWQKSFRENKNFIIIEHDVVPTANIPLEWDVYRMKYFCVTNIKGRYNTWEQEMTPAGGYVLHPDGAKFMLDRVLDTQYRIKANVDSQIYTCRDRGLDPPPRLAEQIKHTDKTIQHDEW